jgi:hypothetical protein
MVITVTFLCNEKLPVSGISLNSSTDTTFFADASVPLLCEDQQLEEAHFGSSVCAVRALADYPMYSRHSSFKEPGCHETPELGAEPAV